MRRRVARLGLAAAILSAAACQGGAEEAPLAPATERLQQMLLSRPAGVWLLAGRFELRQEEYDGTGGASGRDLPMTSLSWSEFQAWAEPRGLRGPTTAEWRALAGTPASAAEAASLTRNTLELGIGRPLPVGVFERGRSALGAYDFYGNVWELTAPDASGRLIALGGSYASREVGPEAREGFALGAGERAEDVGARYVADAVPYFLERVRPEWELAPETVGALLGAAAASWQPGLRAAFARALLDAGLPAELCARIEA